MKPARKIFIFKVLAAAFLLTAVTVFFSWDRLLSFAFEKHTGYEIFYSAWSGNPMGKSVMASPELVIKSAGVNIQAEEIIFRVKAFSIFKERGVAVECSLSDAVFFLSSGDKEGADNILELVSVSGQVFNSVKFQAYTGKDLSGITGLYAESSDIKIRGHGSLDKKSNSLEIDVNVSVSPGLIAGLGENVKDRVLSPEGNGWYGTSITYRGDPAFLMALYFAVAPQT
jgi:hypothetical protein